MSKHNGQRDTHMERALQEDPAALIDEVEELEEADLRIAFLMDHLQTETAIPKLAAYARELATIYENMEAAGFKYAE